MIENLIKVKHFFDLILRFDCQALGRVIGVSDIITFVYCQRTNYCPRSKGGRAEFFGACFCFVGGVCSLPPAGTRTAMCKQEGGQKP